ncbi:MAG: hypothetical protein ACOY0T_19320 [Myxococcota bacterium]
MPTLSSNIVKRQIASVHDVEEALARQAVYGGDLATNLLELASVSEAQLADVIAESLGLEAAPAGELPPAPERVRRLVPGDIAQRYGLCPLSEVDGKLIVAVSEPLPHEVVSDLEFSLGLPLVQHASTLVRVQQAVARDYGLALDQRVARVLARLAGEPDPHPSVPVLDAPEPEQALEQTLDLRNPPAAEAPEVERAFAPKQEQARESSLVPELSPSVAAPEGPPTTQPYLIDPNAAPGATTETPPNEEATREAAARRAARRANIDLFALARRERQTPRDKRRRGPYTLAMAEEDLLDAETRDEVVSAFFDFSAQYFEYAALFAVHGDLAEGRNAHGAGAPRAKVQAIGVPLDLPSTLAQVAAAEPYRLTRLSASGIDGALAKDLERRPGPLVLILPIRVRSRTVLVFYGDHGSNDVALDAVGDVISFAPLVAAALERLILRRKERARGEPAVSAQLALPKQRRVELPTRGERASALAQVLESSASRRPPAPSHPPEQPVASAPPLARPVISIGPTRASGAPLETRTESKPALASPSLRPVVRTTRTPIPSSFAPNAPPHEPAPATRKSVPDETATDDGWEEAPQPAPKPEVGSGPPLSLNRPAPYRAPEAEGQLHEEREQRELETTQRYHMPAGEIERAIADEQRRLAAAKTGRLSSPPPETKAVTAPPPPVATAPTEPAVEAVAPTPGVEATQDALAATLRQEGPSVDIEAGDALVDQEITVSESPQLSVATETLGEDEYEEAPRDDDDSAPLAPLSRSIAHSARPLPIPGSSVELRLPAVIVDIAQDTEDLVARLAAGDERAADRLVQIGAAAVPGLVGAFPGPITSELRRGGGEGPPKASDCGPLLKVLARIGPKAAGVLAVRSNDKDSMTRAWATRLLGEMPCLDAARAVTRRFVDDDAEVRRAALAAGRMLQAHPGTGAVLASTLSEMLLDSTRQDRLQHMVIEAIADLREARAVPALATLLATGSPEIQRSAHWALVVLARTDYADNAAAWDEWWRVNSSRHRVEWLIDALMHESQEIRRAAGDELKSLTKEYFGYYDDLPARERERAQKRYRDWWDTKGKARFM